MVKLSSSDVDATNIVKPTPDQLSAEDRQAYEAFIKECEEENTRRKEKEIEEKRQWFLSHFSRNRKGEVFKDKEVVILSDEEEQAKAKNNVSTSASPVTMKQISQLLVDGQKKVLATVQNMIDKSLEKQPWPMIVVLLCLVLLVLFKITLCLLNHRRYMHHSTACR